MTRQRNIKILIPLAGAGSRFFKEGYTDPKPLIDVAGKPMIRRVIENINMPDMEHIFIVQRPHIEKCPQIKEYLSNCVEKSTIVEIEGLTEGAACTTLLAEKHLDDTPLLIVNADQWVDWVPSHFIDYCSDLDGCIPFFLSDSPKHSYSKVN